MNDYENCLFKNAMMKLICDIKRGEDFANEDCNRPCDPCDPEPSAPPCPENPCEERVC